MTDNEELDGLPLPERIRKLREIERTALRDIEKARKLRENFEEELFREKTVEGIEIPRPEPIDITKLFFSNGGLEASAQIEQVANEDFQVEYTRFLEADDDIGDLYVTVTNIVQVANKIDQLIDAPKYNLPRDKVTEETTASVGVAEKIRKYTHG